MEKKTKEDIELSELWKKLDSINLTKESTKNELDLVIDLFDKISKNSRLTFSERMKIKMLKKIYPTARKYLK